ncbi:MAG: isoaspartyl peptidase/L-asparaginase family protein [Acidobacteriota bacterium]
MGRAVMLGMGVALAAAGGEAPPRVEAKPYALAIHGGAGVIRRGALSPEKEAAVRKALEAAVLRGKEILERGGSSLDAVEAAVRLLEDAPEFNAGRGAVFTSEGSHEMDAAIMEGATLRAGAVTGVRRVKNPVSLARWVMEHSPHVFLSGPGADLFAREAGLEVVPPSYFHTDERWQDLQKAKARAGEPVPQGPPQSPEPHGTVGAVALDLHGHLAAATSTGGMTNKRPGRIGDSPVIGAGTYADDRTCAVSCTGWGEFFLRAVAAHDVAARMAYGNRSLDRAAQEVLARIAELGGDGGLIAVDGRGNLCLRFTTEGMYRAWLAPGGKVEVRIYGDEEPPGETPPR